MPELSVNRRALFDYDVLETFEAGIELKGHEVKSIVLGRANLSGAHATIQNNEAWLLNSDVPPYQAGNTPDGYNSKRNRKLLLNLKETTSLIGRTKEKGLTLIPLKMYTKRGKIKILLGLARSRKKGDKRDVIRKRETEREIRRVSS